MLPSKGYFKSLECPYYTESFCDRPYCHFKHSRQDFLSDSKCQIATESKNKPVVSITDEPKVKSKLPEEPRLKQKVKSKIIEYIPQPIKPKNSELGVKYSTYGSTTEMSKIDSPILEYIPSCVNDTNLDFKLENFKSNNELNGKEEQTKSINYIEGISTTYNISTKQNTNISEYIPTVIEKLSDKTNNTEDKNHHEHRSSSKRKHESSKKSSSRSKKPKRDKSSEHKKDKKDRDKEKKCEKKHSRDKSNESINLNKINTSTISSGPKSLRETVMEKVQKKLVKLDPLQSDIHSSSDEGNDPSTSLIESSLNEFFGSDDSDSEQKSCNVVAAKVKKRISHISPTSIFAQINAKTVLRPKTTKSLHEIVANRVLSIQNNAIEGRSSITTKNLNSDPSLPLLKTKTRIAHQSKIEPSTTETQTSNNSGTVNKEITANIKLNLRIKSFKTSNNMPNPLRQSCLEKLYTAFSNHYSSEEAINKAHTTEEEVHSKAKSSGIYRNLIVQSLMKANKSPQLQVKSNPYYPSHMHGVCLYDLLKKYILTKDDLEKNGYPLIDDNKLVFISKNAYYYRPLSKKRNGDKFVCMNCRSEFEVDKRGMPIVTLTKCTYHSGKLKFERAKNEKFWLCCYKRQHESGCESSIYHMPDKFDEDALENFVVTKSKKSDKNSEVPNFYALDCEMVNTTFGIEIVRVTVINHEGEEVYESKVKPFNTILDYKSKYSGITEESLRYCTKRLSDVQQDLLKIFDKDSILIGHSLESDLKALKMVHYNVVDTSIIYPHKYGPPYKWGLKLLAEQHLQRIIQSEEGHDSKEDALASLDLVWKKLKEDVKKFKPINIISIDKR
ncbi:RNA exonuclease 1 homolog [Melanaphis sacchari]|uniref:RNA exonuclease 1 n=1 Tax=Melanaphis sacchari TaxID=742174 RepID=A0A2H8TP92_9HEMI|nr:RNA exonuclease 1 homolog [Melanaphis sacchari]